MFCINWWETRGKEGVEGHGCSASTGRKQAGRKGWRNMGVLHQLVGKKGGKGGGGCGCSASTGGKQGGRKGWRDVGVLHQLVEKTGQKQGGRGGGRRGLKT